MEPEAVARPPIAVFVCGHACVLRFRSPISRYARFPATRPLPPRPPHPDRKSVVSGKSVCVGVALGGRRLITTKKTTAAATNHKNNRMQYARSHTEPSISRSQHMEKKQ